MVLHWTQFHAHHSKCKAEQFKIFVPFQDKCCCANHLHFEVQNGTDFKCITLLLKYIIAIQMGYSVQQQLA